MITTSKGTYDILPGESRKWHVLEAAIHRVAERYHFEEIRTPVFETSDLFHRSVGETSDIVTKETYDFSDRKGRPITLRPEGTAGVVRSVIEHKLYARPDLPLKLFYLGPMFRYERPQKGRQRQFHQFGAETLGSDQPLADAETIGFAMDFLHEIGIASVSVHINSLGDGESKTRYRDELKTYLRPHVDQLCEDCQRRFDDNPLRILDCKVDRGHPVLEKAPKPLDWLSDEDRDHFDRVLAYLDAMDIDYIIDDRLVRGLDYYTHTVFEIEADHEALGAQSVVCAGGRYNHLVESLGGPDFPAVGFAFGMERLLLTIPDRVVTEEEGVDLFFIAMGENVNQKAMALIKSLRDDGWAVDYDFFNRSLKAQFKQAERNHPVYYLIFGDREMADGTINVKDAKSGKQTTVELDRLKPTLADMFADRT